MADSDRGLFSDLAASVAHAQAVNQQVGQNPHQEPVRYTGEQLAELYTIEEGEPALPPQSVTGNKKAVIVGINYIGHAKGTLNGCIPDAQNMQNFLSQHGFTGQNVRKLTDDNPNAMPTKANMLAAMKWLVSGATAGDSLFFHYSGHGGQEKDSTHLEDDGMNETVIPVDYQSVGQISDDVIHATLVKGLPAGVRLTAIFDSCHSGTVMDLPYLYHSEEKEYKEAHKDDKGGFFHRHKLGITHFSAVGIASSVAAVAGGEIFYQGKKKLRKEILKKKNTSAALVMQISGCRDEQTSADTAALTGTSTGAMSYAFISTMTNQPQQSWRSLIKGMRDTLHNGPKRFTQMPQLCMGRAVSADLPVIL